MEQDIEDSSFVICRGDCDSESRTSCFFLSKYIFPVAIVIIATVVKVRQNVCFYVIN